MDKQDITIPSYDSIALVDKFLLNEPLKFEEILIRAVINNNMSLIMYLTNFGDKFVDSHKKRQNIFGKALAKAAETDRIELGTIIVDFCDHRGINIAKAVAIDTDNINFQLMLEDELSGGPPKGCYQNGLCGLATPETPYHGKIVPNSTSPQHDIASKNPFYNIQADDKLDYMLKLLD